MPDAVMPMSDDPLDKDELNNIEAVMCAERYQFLRPADLWPNTVLRLVSMARAGIAATVQRDIECARANDLAWRVRELERGPRVHGDGELVALQAKAVVAYWDSLDTVSENDPRPTGDFKAEMDARIGGLRYLLEQADNRTAPTGLRASSEETP